MPAGLAHQYRQAKLAREINAAKREAARAEREQIELRRLKGDLIERAVHERELLADALVRRGDGAGAVRVGHPVDGTKAGRGQADRSSLLR